MLLAAGPKMRKWYGEGDRLSLDGDYPNEPDEEDGVDKDDEAYGDGDAVLVLDADGTMGEQVVTQLILNR